MSSNFKVSLTNNVIAISYIKENKYGGHTCNTCGISLITDMNI